MRESVIYQEILAEGEAKGRLEGQNEALEKVALRLLRQGLALEQVVAITELSLAEVEVLHQRLQADS